MKESAYNFSLSDATGMVLYNAMSDQIVMLKPQLAALYNEGREQPEIIGQRHQELYDYLCSRGFLVDNGTDELKRFIDYMTQRDESGETLKLIINPTLACNMKCWYCYEQHKDMPAMSTDVTQAITKMVDKRAASGKLKQLHLSFFGGEPLLYYDTVVRNILAEVSQVCKHYGTSLSLHFTTNAYLLTPSLLEELAPFHPSFQITLDGNKHVHNTVRRTTDNHLTYETIVSHIHEALAKGCPVTVRCNYTRRSLPSFIDILLDFERLPEGHKRLLNFDFQRVWQDHGGDAQTLMKDLEEMEEAFRKAGLSVTTPNDYYVGYCYADEPGTVVVNYDGNLFKCTARDFTPDRRDGTLTPEGEIQWNEQHAKRMAIRFGSETCRKCRIYPICHGGCSQMKLETPETASCPKGYDEERITAILKGRALFLLNQIKSRK